MTISFSRNFITFIIGPVHSELFALALGKIAESDNVYTLASTNINQSVPNLVKMYLPIKYRMSLIIYVIKPDLSKISALKLEKLPHLTAFTL